MWTDPIVEEVRAIRREIAAEVGNDLHRLCERAREWERQNPERIEVPGDSKPDASHGLPNSPKGPRRK